MGLHEHDISKRLAGFLDRKAAPRHLTGEGRESALDAETAELTSVAARAAPRDPDYLRDWWPVFENALNEACGRSYPTIREIRDAAKRASAERQRPSGNSAPSTKLDDVAITARRMRAGEAVGEEWLYGRLAVEMIARGEVDQATMDRYRSAAYHARKHAYGADKAQAWEVDAKARHAAAIRARHADRSQRDTSVPDRFRSSAPRAPYQGAGECAASPVPPSVRTGKR